MGKSSKPVIQNTLTQIQDKQYTNLLQNSHSQHTRHNNIMCEQNVNWLYDIFNQASATWSPRPISHSTSASREMQTHTTQTTFCFLHSHDKDSWISKTTLILHLKTLQQGFLMNIGRFYKTVLLVQIISQKIKALWSLWSQLRLHQPTLTRFSHDISVSIFK